MHVFVAVWRGLGRTAIALAIVLSVLSVDVLAQFRISTLVEDVPFGPQQDGRSHLVTSGGRVFWADESERPLKSIAVGGGPITDHASAMGVPASVVVSGASAYFVDLRGPTPSGCPGRVVMWAATAGTALPTVVASGEGCLFATAELVLDDSFFYWVSATATTSTILRVPLSGGPPVTIYTTNTPVLSLAADGTDLYWVEGLPSVTPNPVPQKIRRMPRPGGVASDVASLSSFLCGGIVPSDGEVFFAEGLGATYAIRKALVGGGTVTTLAPASVRPLALAVNGGAVYWTDATSIHAVPVTGGLAAVIQQGLGPPVGLTVQGQSLYWTENLCCPVGGRVMKSGIAGGPVQVIADGLDAPGVAVVVGMEIFWTEGQPLAQAPIGAGRIAKAPIGGGAVVTVASGISTGILTPFAVDSTSIYAADDFKIKRVPIAGVQQLETLARGPGGGIGIVDVATDGVHVYWADEYSLRRIPVGGGATTDLPSLSLSRIPLRMALGSTHVFWADAFAIYKVPRAGGPPVTLADSLALVSDLAADEAFVYFAERDSGRIARIPVDGGLATPVADSRPNWKTSIAVDAASIYWVDYATIYRAPKNGGPATPIAYEVYADPVLQAAIVTDGTGVTWTEVAADRIRRAAPPVPPTFTLSLNAAAFEFGDTMILDAILTAGTAGTPVDAYVVEQLPNGTFRSLQLGGGRIAGIVPIARGFLPFPFAGQLLRATVDSTTLAGPHVWLSGLAQPGTLNLIGPIGTVPFTVRPAAPPGSPTNLTHAVVGATVNFNWTAPGVGGAPASYRLEAGSAPGAANIVPAFDTGSTATSIGFSGVPGGTYYVRLRAVNAIGVSAASNEVIVVVR